MSSTSRVDRTTIYLQNLESIIQELDASESDKDFNSSTFRNLQDKIRKVFHDLEPLISPEGDSQLDQKVVAKFRQLEMRKIALEHRVAIEFGGRNPTKIFAFNHYGHLQVLAQKWISKQPLQSHRVENGQFVPVNELAAHQLQKLQDAVRYSGFYGVLLKDKALRVDFFKWALLDNCPVAPFVEFYGTCQKTIQNAFLHKRAGYFSGAPLQIDVRKKDSRVFKRLTLPFETNDGSVKARSVLTLDKEISVRGLNISKREIFRQFSKKKETPGDFEMFEGKIGLWNYFFGRKNSDGSGYHDFTLSSKDWYRHLPVFDRFTEAEMRARYNINEPINPTQWVMAICANRQSDTMDIQGTHGFLVFLIPDGQGNYLQYPFTFLARKFVSGYTPGSFFDILAQVWRLGTTELAFWSFPDETLFYPRQQGFLPFVIDAAMGERHMEKMREDILNAREGYAHFQISYKNCAGTVWEQARDVHGENVIPPVFTADILESTPRGRLGKVFSWIRARPNWMVYTIIWLVGAILCTLRGMVIRVNGRYDYACMLRTPIFTARRIYHAAKIFEYLFKNNVGAIWYGHTPKELDSHAQSS